MKLTDKIRRIMHRIDNNDEIAVARSIGVTVGDNCVFNENARKIFGTEPYLITIGSHVEIAEGVRFLTHEGGVWCFRNKSSYKNVDAFAPIIVGNNVFIGMNSIIMPGVKIKDNVIIGAHSVITRDIMSDSVVAGTPAKRICSIQELFDRLSSEESKKKMVMTRQLSSEKKRVFLKNQFPAWFNMIR